MVAVDEIHLLNIEGEFKRLWDEEKGKNRVRACFFNLIIYTEKSDKSPQFRALVNSVVAKFPCRVTLITAEPHERSYLNTTVSTQAITDEIFCEIIEINVGGDLIERVPFLVLPHLLPDLPIHLLWTVDPAQELTVLPALEPYATRLIIDSSCITNLQDFSKNVLGLLEKFRCDVGDLNWSALRSWRRIFRTTFDSKASFNVLANTKLLRIRYKKGPGFESSEIFAAYFQAWIAAQLGWKLKTVDHVEKSRRLVYTRAQEEATVLLSPEENLLKKSSLRPGSLLSIELESTASKSIYVFKRQESSSQVFVQHSDEVKCNLPYCTFLTGLKEGQEIIQEIFYTTGGTQYRNTLRLLSELPWN